MRNNDYSIDLWYSQGDVLKRNIVSNGVDGIYLWRSDGNVIADNMITKNTMHGVLLESSSTNTFGGNIISDNIKGVVLSWSGCNSLENNDIVNSTRNFGVYGQYLSDFIQNIETSNTINKKPIYYLTNQTGLTVDSTMFPNIGYLGLINSTNIIVKDITLTQNEQGVLLAYVTNSTIEKTNASDNVEGIYLYASRDNQIMDNQLSSNENNAVSLQFSESNTISGNVIRDNKGRGITIYDSTGNTASKNAVGSNTLGGVQLQSSEDNLIIENVVSNNPGYGVEIVDFSSDNVIRQNDIIGNIRGISLDECSGNSLCHNNFIDNVYQVAGVDFWLQENIWDNGRKEGNYWSDYAGKDLNGDGIGDTGIPHLGVDHYPLMSPYILGDLNHDGTVNIIDVAIVAWSFNSYPGHSRWNLHADLNGDSSINILDIAMVASNFGKKWESF
jgi:parallel beta-helix repeat protein